MGRTSFLHCAKEILGELFLRENDDSEQRHCQVERPRLSQAVFDPFFISMYNIFYTSMPVLFMGALDQDVREETALRYNQLYAPGILNLFFSKSKFLVTASQGLFSSFTLVAISIGTCLTRKKYQREHH